MEIIAGGKGVNEQLQAQAHLWNHTFNFISSMSLKCAVQLGIPDIIHNHHQPITLSQLVKSLPIPQSKSACVYRLMRILVHSGFFARQKIDKEQQEEGYVLTPSSKLLVKDHATSLSPFLLMMLDPVLVTPWHFLSSWFQGSKLTPFEAAHGSTFWDYGAKHLDVSESFNEAMACDAQFVMSVVVNEGKAIFGGLKSLVDVGGGTGTVARALAEAFPHLKCTVFDRPHVVGTLQGSKNLEFVEGDMFESIPPADAILFKSIMHDWTDEECVKILKRSKEAIISSKDEGGKVIIIDMVVDDKKRKYEEIETQLCFDIMMMVLLTGKERTEKEWEQLFLESGFTHYKITPILGLRSLIEVFP